MSPRLLCAIAIPLFAAAAVAGPFMPPPKTPAGNTVDVIHGTKVADPYRWLENWSDPKVQAWSDAENTRTRFYLDHLPNRAAVHDRLSALIKATSPSYTGFAARGERVFASYTDPKFQQPILVVLDAAADPKSLSLIHI